MRKLLLAPLALLTACFDGVTSHIAVDLKAGTAHVEQQFHNAWPDTVGCGEGVDVPGCVAAVRAEVADHQKQLQGKGATVERAGIALAAGALDLVYVYDAPVGAKALQDEGLAIVRMQERTARQYEAGGKGKDRVAMLSFPSKGTASLKVEGRYTVLGGDVGGDNVQIFQFRGKSAMITSEWTYTPGPDDQQASPGKWLAAHAGLEDALRASGLVVDPAK